jgi:hypothetical protein
VNQEEADRHIPKQLTVPATKRFLSMEPLLGPVDLGQAHAKLAKEPLVTLDHLRRTSTLPTVDWVFRGDSMKKTKSPTYAALYRDARQGERQLFRLIAGREKRRTRLLDCGCTFSCGREVSPPFTGGHKRRRSNDGISIYVHRIRVGHVVSLLERNLDMPATIGLDIPQGKAA